MFKKTVCAILFIVLMSSPAMVNAGIPIADLSAFAQRISLLAKEIAKWTIYISKFKSYAEHLGRLKNNFESTLRGFIEGELNELVGDNIDVTLNVIKSIAYEDADKQDEWTEIFKDVQKLEIKYENIKDTEYLKQNKLYQNPYLKEGIDRQIKQREDNLTNIKNTIKNLQLIRESEMEMVKKISGYEKQIKALGVEKEDYYLSESKITTIMNLMDLDILKLNTNIMELYRMMLENELKQAAEEELESQNSGRSIQEEIENYKIFQENK